MHVKLINNLKRYWYIRRKMALLPDMMSAIYEQQSLYHTCFIKMVTAESLVSKSHGRVRLIIDLTTDKTYTVTVSGIYSRYLDCQVHYLRYYII